MRSSIKFLSLAAILTMGAAACGTQPAVEPTQPATTLASPTVGPSNPVPAETGSVSATEIAAATAPPVVPAATSRGPELEATDPTTVTLASGQVQLVEFFRFT